MLKIIMSDTYRNLWQDKGKAFINGDRWMDENHRVVTTDDEPLAGSLISTFEAGFKVSDDLYS